MYEYTAIARRVIDGDTVELEIDLGFRMSMRAPSRLYGINTPELRAADPQVRLAAQQAKAFLEGKLGTPRTVHVQSKALDKYGRPLVVLWLDGENLNQALLDAGLAVSYNP